MSDTAAAGIWLDGATGRRRHPIAVGSVVAGRSQDAGLVIADEHVSNHHAELYWDGESLRVRDLGSRNGTFVNGATIDGWTPISTGDVVRFGVVDGVVDVPGQAPRPVAAASGPVAPITDAPSTELHVAAGSLQQRPIFISHSSEDTRDVRMIGEYLRARGWTVWVDETGIAGGEAWRARLMQALEESWIVLLVVSHASMTSTWVMREMDAADRLGLRVIPVAVEPVPYPDGLRMMLSGVQQLDATGLHDSDERSGQLARIDDALISAARARTPGKPGRLLIALGTVILVIGVIGLIVGGAAFVYLGQQAVSEGPGGDSPSPFLGWGVFAVSLVVSAIGGGIRQAGRRRGI